MVVSTSPHHTLTSLYGKTLRAIAKMPENAAYRKYTEKIVTERAKIVANVSHKQQKTYYYYYYWDYKCINLILNILHRHQV